MATTTENQAPSTEASASPLPEPILTLPRLIIRLYHPSDALAASQNGNDVRIAQYMTNIFPSPYELHHAESFINTIALVSTRPSGAAGAAPVHLYYAICRRTDGAYMGGIGLKPLADVEARTWEFGYWIGADHWGRGYMSEAVPAFVEWAFRTFPDVLRLEASVYEGNLGSQRVLRKSGFREEGVRRKAIWKNGKRLDNHIFGMLREECPGLAVES